jgi:hypothetical protein
VKGAKAKMISTEGDLDHWEIKALFSEPNSIEAIADLLNKRIASNMRYIKGAVTLSPSGANNSAINWKFTDDEGHAWNGEKRIDPASDLEGQFLVTLKLARQTDYKST